MALVVGVNSWVTRAEADTYFDDRINNTPWTALTDSEKDQYLITAFNWIFYDSQFTAPSSSTATAVKNGQCEAALFLINYGDEWAKRDAFISSGVTSFDFSKWSEDLSQVSKPDGVKNYFSSEGFFSGNVGVTILSDSNTNY
jgi:hypothetical protein